MAGHHPRGRDKRDTLKGGVPFVPSRQGWPCPVCPVCPGCVPVPRPDKRKDLTVFPPGFAIDHKGQLYRPLRIREHVKPNGSTVRGIDWRTTCPDCGVVFTVFTPLVWDGEPTRRCQDCKAPGKPVQARSISA